MGASNISYAVIEDRVGKAREAKEQGNREANDREHKICEDKTGNSRIRVIETGSVPHEGDPRRILDRFLKEGFFQSVHYLAVTGRKYRHILKAAKVSEPEAVEGAYGFIRDAGWPADAIISGGGETFMIYTLDREGRIKGVMTGNKCASGTGEFFLQQLKRLGLGLEEAMEVAAKAEPYKVSGRCSVFCKSDCTHALNKGAAKGSIVAGLCRMMAVKILELLRGMELGRPLLVGGISRNEILFKGLTEKLPGAAVPPYAQSFEALGAALWALEGKKDKPPGREILAGKEQVSFSHHPAPEEYLSRVHFAGLERGMPRKGDSCILGLDVGSTTTKAVLVRRRDKALLAGCYLRTLGDPVAAARECYRRLQADLGPSVNIDIAGLGVTGSGRQIAALHALTPAVINEIIAHAAAAVHFDPQVDTILEIGGQDAKYTYLVNGVPADYAMNEACSAGTGSFLEEAAAESLGIGVDDIGDLALKSKNPLNFSDQCAAFINSDIKTAIQEGCSLEDIAAGLVYSICLNYKNRVKGNRRVGGRVFMQGGVCYNRAVPAAMAALTGKEILVPPEPGLMGAFGVALEVHKRMNLGLIKPSSFNLTELAAREVSPRKPFQCSGGEEGCDRACTIKRVHLKGRTYPFGGACNKYANLLTMEGKHEGAADLVKVREDLALKKFGRDFARPLAPPRGQRVGINTSLMAATLYPLYYNFFALLGFQVVSADQVCREGLDRKGASYCHPVEQAHGLLAGLLAKKPDFVFLPHVRSLPVPGGEGPAVTCPFVQGEPYYLQLAFPELKGRDIKVLSPVLEMAAGYEGTREVFLGLARQLGVSLKIGAQAFDVAVKAQEEFHRECRRRGRAFLESLEQQGKDRAVVLFGRSYNAFSKGINMAVPGKFASRGCPVIPHDFLPLEDEENFEGMYWSAGQMLLKAARFVKKHHRLYGAYITNFSCGPDSFITGYFRDIMGDKPSLTLELDSHTADAGLDTRIEALLDVVDNYSQRRTEGETASADGEMAGSEGDPAGHGGAEAEMTGSEGEPVCAGGAGAELTQGEGEPAGTFRMAKTYTRDKDTLVVDSRGRTCTLQDSRVQVLVPAMGLWGAEFLAAALRHVGVSAAALPPPGGEEFKLGQGLSTCKECLPFILTLGSLMKSLKGKAGEGLKAGTEEDILVYFMPETSGPCRFGQYNVQMKQVIKREGLENVAFLSLTSANGYAGFGVKLAMRAWQAVIINDALEEIYSTILALAEDREKALELYRQVSRELIRAVEFDSWPRLKEALWKGSKKLKSIKIKQPLEAAPRIVLIGEIYVRQDSFSLKNLISRLADRGVMVRTAPVAEWLYYCDYLVKEGLVGGEGSSPSHRSLSSRLRPLSMGLKGFFKRYFEREVKGSLAASGLYEAHPVEVEALVEGAKPYMSPRLTGEAILTIGSALVEGEKVSGVIAIGPFGCMPGRMAEAIISRALDATGKGGEKGPAPTAPLPFLAVETDGNPFTPVIEARLDAFCLQVHRRHRGEAQKPLSAGAG